MDQVSQWMAHNVTAMRHARNLTQASLAKLAGVPRSTITYIESGEGNPSLRNLLKLAAALQVGIETLLARPRSDCSLIRAVEIPVESRGNGMAHLFKLLPDPIPGMEIDRMEIDPGGKLAGIPHLESTKEYLTCTEGRVTVHVAGERFDLDPGDLLAFPGNRPHGYANHGEVRAQCISVVVIWRH